MIIEVLALLGLTVWLYLVVARGGFWLCGRWEVWRATPPTIWPRVAAVIPARNEALGVGDCVASLLRQDYPGEWAVVLVDDDSTDGTASVAMRAAAAIGEQARLRVLAGQPLAAGWTGKLWAVKQGVEAAQAMPNPPDYLLLTDADIVYEPEVLKELVAHAIGNKLVLTSLMVKLRCESLAERSLVPAFIFF